MENVDGIVSQKELLKNAETKMKLGQYKNALIDYNDYWNKYPTDSNGYLSYLHIVMYDDDFRKNNIDLFNDLLINETKEKKSFYKTASNDDIEVFDKEFNKFLRDNEKIIDENIIKYIDLENSKIELNDFVNIKYKINDEKIVLMREYFYVHLLSIFDNITMTIFNKNDEIKDVYRYDKTKYQLIDQSNKHYTLCEDCKTNLLGTNKLMYAIMKYPEFNILGIKENNKIMFNILDNDFNKIYGVVEIPNFDSITYEELKIKLSKFDTFSKAKERVSKYKQLRGDFGSPDKVLKITGLEKNAILNDPKYIFKDGLIITGITYSSDSYYQGYKSSNYDICFKLKNTSVIDKM